MDTRRNVERWPQVLGALLLMSAAIAAGAYYYFNRTDSPDAASREPPNPDFTTAPAGGVKVELPATPMTSTPDTAPLANDVVSGNAPASPEPPQT